MQYLSQTNAEKMPSRLSEYAYLSFGFSRVFLIWMLEYLHIISNGERQVTINELLNPEILSKLIKEDVDSVTIDDGTGVSRGAGGTGTSRAPLWVKLRNGQEMHLFAKTPTKSLAERAFFTVFGVYDNEVNFYAKYFNKMNLILRKEDWDIGPRVFCSKKFGCGKFLILLEDPRFRQPHSAVFKTTLERPFSVEGGRSVLELLANMHAVYWNDTPKDIWMYSSKTGASLGATPPFLLFLAYSAIAKIDKQYGKELTFYPDVREAFNLGMREYHTLRAYWSSGKALTMSHGDAHMGNVFTTQSNLNLAGFVDFQCVAVEHCMRDVSYHLVNSCPAEELTAIEEGMIRQYLSALKMALFRQGKGQQVPDIPDYEEAYFQYRLHAFWTLIAWVMCCGFADIVMQDFVVQSLQRALDTCHRLDILSAIKEALRRHKQPQEKSNNNPAALTITADISVAATD